MTQRPAAVRIARFYDTHERIYPGISKRKSLVVVQRIDVPPGDYIAPLVGVKWRGG